MVRASYICFVQRGASSSVAVWSLGVVNQRRFVEYAMIAGVSDVVAWIYGTGSVVA